MRAAVALALLVIPVRAQDDLCSRGDRAFERRDFEDARDLWRSHLRQRPDSWQATLGLARCGLRLGELYLRMGETRRAGKECDEAIALARHAWGGLLFRSTRSTANARVQPWRAAACLAEALIVSSRLDHREGESKRKEARELLGRLAGMEHPSPRVLEMHGDLLLAEGSFPEAMSSFERALTALAASPRPSTPPLDRRRSWRVERRLHLKVADATRHRVAAGSVAIPAPALRAKLKELQASALTHYREAQALAPELRVLRCMGELEGALGLYESAIDTLQRCITAAAAADEVENDLLHELYRLLNLYRRRLEERKSLPEVR